MKATANHIHHITRIHTRAFPVLALALVSVMLLGSCGSKRQATSGTYAATETAFPIISDSEMLLTLAEDANADWTALTIPVKLSLTSPASASMSGRATMLRDKSIYISLRVLGMEVAYLYADTDSIYAVDKFHKYYLCENISALQERYGITLGNIQDLLLGRPFMPGGTTLRSENLALFQSRGEMYGEQRMIMLEPGSQSRMESVFVIGADANGLPITAGFAIQSEEGHSLMGRYTDPVRTAHGTIPAEVDLSAIVGENPASCKIKWTVKEAKWDDKASDINFRQPGSNYKKVSAADLMKMLKTPV